jgi:type I restriction enzyme, S subunit
MDAQQFLAEFGHIANAPGGVARLRELVLHLAVSGHLSKQVAGENAADLLDEIRTVQTVLQADGAIRANRKVRSEKVLGHWEIPPNWIWCRFGELCSFSAGRTPSRKEGKYWNTGDYPWFSIADLLHGQVVSVSSETVSEEARAEVFKSEPSPIGSLLMSFKLSIGKISVLGVTAYHNEAIVEIKPFSPSLKDYFFKCLNGFDLLAGNKAAIKGSTLNQDSLSNIFIALPPKREISRIVAKVEELMLLCDQLEKQQQDRRKLQGALRQSTLQALASAQSPQELQTSWHRLHANFRCLFSEPADVDLLRGTFLQLAVSGQLLPQNPEDEPARELLQRIAAERARLVKEGKVSKPKPLRPVTDADVPFRVPNGWNWARFADVANIASNLVQPQYHPAAPHIAPDSIEKGSGRLMAFRTVADDGVRSSKHQFYPGQILYSKIRPNLSKVVIVNFGGLCSADMYPIDAWLDAGYLHCYMLSGSFLTQVVSEDNRLAMPKVNQAQLSDVLVPVPPLDEQKRIVAKLNQLMLICEKLEDQLNESERTASRLAIAAVANLTGIAIEQDEDIAVKAPQTELHALLRLAIAPDVKAQAPLATILVRHQGEMAARDLWQRFGGDIDAFYAQLKAEVAHGWIAEPEVALVREKPIAEAVGA